MKVIVLLLQKYFPKSCKLDVKWIDTDFRETDQMAHV